MGSFQVSSGRSLFQRLTPLAWLLVGLVIFFGLAFVIVGVPRLLDTLAANPAPPATATPTQVAPTATPVVATPEPTAQATAPVTDTAAFPAFWATGMYQDAQGQWWPAEEVRVQVQQMVEEHYRECNELLSGPQDQILATITDAQARECYSGDLLDGWFWEKRRFLDTGRFNERAGVTTDNLITVQGFSEDGLTCLLGETYLAGYVLTYDTQSATWVRTDVPADGLVDGVQNLGVAISQMRYDPEDGRWKSDRFVQWIPRSAP